MVYANFDAETGECLWCGTGLGDVKLPDHMTGLFPKRYHMVDGVVVDKYEGQTDEEVESAWWVNNTEPQSSEQDDPT